MDKEYIYVLYFEEDGQENIFYCGRSNDPERRLDEHLNDKSQSKKAKFIRFLLKNGLNIRVKVIQEAKRDDDEWTVQVNLEGAGHVLVNSIAGNLNHKIKTEAVLSMVTATDLQKAVWMRNPLYKDQTYVKLNGFTFIRFGKGVCFEIRANGKKVEVQGKPLLGEKMAFKQVAEVANSMVDSTSC